MTTYNPFIHWAQNDRLIFLKVDLKDVKDPDINLEKRRLEFKSKGVGARGLHDYAFNIDFNRDISVKDSVYKLTDNRVDFSLVKSEKSWWPRLTSQVQKPIWLKIDHDRFQSEDLDADEINEEVGDIRDDYPSLYERLQTEELGYRREDFKKVYLTLYNLFMYVGFMYVVCVLCVRYLKDGVDSFPHVYEAVGPAMCFLQLLQVLEIFHPVFGYVKGGPLMPFMQVGGRLFVLFFMLEFEPRLQTMPVVFYLFMTWSAIEIIRYPYYMSQLFRKENALLTWIRYTAWIVCYPVGFICEGVIIFRNLIFLEQSGKWSVALPESIGWDLKFSTILRVYMLFIMIPAMYTLMAHMYKARKSKLGPKDYLPKMGYLAEKLIPIPMAGIVREVGFRERGHKPVCLCGALMKKSKIINIKIYKAGYARIRRLYPRNGFIVAASTAARGVGYFRMILRAAIIGIKKSNVLLPILRDLSMLGPNKTKINKRTD